MALKTYRVRREWTVVYCSYVEVEARNKVEACKLAMQDEDYSDQESMDCSDSATWIGSIECDWKELVVPEQFTEESVLGGCCHA